MRARNLETKRKTSLYLNDSLTKEIAKLVPNMNQTEFAHMAMTTVLEQIKKERARDELLEMLKNIKPVKRKETARQTLERLRAQRDKAILAALKPTKSKKINTKKLSKNV